MDGLGELFAAIVKLFVRLLYGVVRIIIRLIGLLTKPPPLKNFARKRMRGFRSGVERAVRDGAGLLDRVLGTRSVDAIPCQDD